MDNTSVCAQIPIRTRGSKKCTVHHGKDVVYFCETCTGLVCGDCVTKEHKGHDFAELETVIPKAKEKIQMYVNEVEEIHKPLINSEIEKVDNELTKTSEYYQQQIKQIRDKTEIIKQELDNIADMMENMCHCMKDMATKTYQTHKNKLLVLKNELMSHYLDYTDFLDSDDSILIFDASNAIPSVSTHPSKPTCKLASFTEGRCSLRSLEGMVGELNIPYGNQTSKSLEQHDRKKPGSKIQQRMEDFFKTGKRPQQYEQEQIYRVSDEIKFQANKDFNATDSTHVSYRKNDIIMDVSVVDTTWMTGTVLRTGKIGRFLQSSFERLPKITPRTHAEERLSTTVGNQHGSDDTKRDAEAIGYSDKSMMSTVCDFKTDAEEEVNFVTGDR